MKEFRSLGLSEKTLATLERKGFKVPTEIQVQAIPLLMENKVDIIAQAQTGTGKTAVFALPLMERLQPGIGHVQAIILAPTRELVLQVCEEIDSLKGDTKVRTAAIYGGQYIDIQFRKLQKGVDIVVGTPGRVLDHIRRGTLVLDSIEYFILDEADEMLNMGFIEDIEEALEQTPKEKRVLLFSATMPPRIKKLAEKYMGEYTHVRSEPELTTDLTEQIYFEVGRKDKLEALCRVLQIEGDFYGIIFCRTKADVDELTTSLTERGFKADNLHGDISQPLREKILGKFRTRRINILVATDVAARGIDVEELTHVINYSIPQNPEAYVHRIGRTGRAGKKGTAITFVTPSELGRMRFIQKFTRADITRQNAPQQHEMVDMKKRQMETSIERLISEKDTEGYRNWAKELLAESSGEDLISALLKYNFGRDLEEGAEAGHRGKRDPRVVDWKRSGPPDRGPKREEPVRGREHHELKDRRSIGEREVEQAPPPASGRTTRLLIAMGKKDRMNKAKIVDMIKSKAGTRPELINEVDVQDGFSLITVPAREAKSILKFFRRTGKGDKPMVMKANDDPRQSSTKGPAIKRYRKKKGRYVRP